MAQIPLDEKFVGLSASTPTFERRSALINSESQTYTMQDIVDTVEDALPPAPVLDTYPVTTSALAGTKFWYKGNEWHYMTQAEIDSAGWNGLVTVGFPAPVSKNLNAFILYNGNLTMISSGGGASFNYPAPPLTGTSVFDFDMLGFGQPQRLVSAVNYATGPGGEFSITLRNFGLLTSLKNLTGTSPAVNIQYSNNLDAAALNQVFTELPPTTQVCTLRFQNNPGSATCNPTIATSKGYIVVV
jgi:hypothetical protein